MDLKLTTIQGGKEHFYKTGIYRQELHFHSEELSSSWRIQRTHDTHLGNLKINGKVIFNFSYSNGRCEVQKIINDESTDWVEIPVEGIMCD